MLLYRHSKIKCRADGIQYRVNGSLNFELILIQVSLEKINRMSS